MIQKLKIGINIACLLPVCETHLLKKSAKTKFAKDVALFRENQGKK